MPAEGRKRLDSVDVAMTHLVRLVVDDTWTADTAAARLRHRVRHDSVLRRARARVAWALMERATPIGERAVATLDAALALPLPVGTATGAAPADGR